MKVIVAGLSKTGTKSMAFALRSLGYNVYDYVENFAYLGDDWKKIFSGNGTIEDFRRMYKDVDAVTDVPCAYFWEELHEAFPDAKIILMTRENEEVWMRSMKTQMDEVYHNATSVFFYLSPNFWKFKEHTNSAGVLAYGQRWADTFQPINRTKANEMVMKMCYRRHNNYVLQAAPKDKLLVYSVKDGWEPLCKFLGVEIPSQPFPHENAEGKLITRMYQIDPVFHRWKTDIQMSLSVIAVLLGLGCYSVARRGCPSWLYFGVNYVQNLFKR